MHQDEFAGFERTLRQLGEAFNRKLTDELVQAYWKALRDLSLAAVMRSADTHMRYGKFFPKPVELRPKDAPAEQKSNPDHDAAVENCIRWNDERMRKDPLATKWRALAAFAARISVTERYGSPEYAERLEFARNACKRLIGESDLAYVGSDVGRIQIIGQLLGGAVMDQAIAARKEFENPSREAA